MNNYAWYKPSVYKIPDNALILGHHGGGYFQFVVDKIPDPKVWRMDEVQQHNTHGVGELGYSFSELVLVSIRRMLVNLEQQLWSKSK
jgi:hypothetical protein